MNEPEINEIFFKHGNSQLQPVKFNDIEFLLFRLRGSYMGIGLEEQVIEIAMSYEDFNLMVDDFIKFREFDKANWPKTLPNQDNTDT